jgi:RNA polymerase sigma-70 factor (ECF subfamily)
MRKTSDSLRAQVIELATFKVAARPKRAESFAGGDVIALESGSRNGRKAHSIGKEASDEALIDAIARGDRHAMALLYARHHVRVYRFALRLSDDATLSEDIVSEVFLDVWRQADRFKAKAEVFTWLLAIARNKSLSVIRRRCDGQLDCEAMDLADPADDPETSFHKRDRSGIIQRCLSQLSTPHREVIDLVYYHEKSVAQAAEIVGVPAGTIKTRMFHARRQMGALLEAAGHCGV